MEIKNRNLMKLNIVFFIGLLYLTNYWRFRILEIRRYGYSDGPILKDAIQVNKFIPLFIKRIFIKCLLWAVSESING